MDTPSASSEQDNLKRLSEEVARVVRSHDEMQHYRHSQDRQMYDMLVEMRERMSLLERHMLREIPTSTPSIIIPQARSLQRSRTDSANSARGVSADEEMNSDSENEPAIRMATRREPRRTLSGIKSSADKSSTTDEPSNKPKTDESVLLGDFPDTPLVKKKSSERREASGEHAETPKDKSNDKSSRRKNPSPPGSDSSSSSSDSSASSAPKLGGESDSSPSGSSSESDHTKRKRHRAEAKKAKAKAEAKKPKHKRRDTIFEVARSSVVAAHTVTQIVKTPPSYDHIVLKVLNVTEVIDFFEAVNLYQTRHKTPLPIATLTSRTVRETLIARARDMTQEKFFQLTSAELLKLIQKHLRPLNVIDFLTKIKTHTAFRNRDSAPQPTVDFPGFYECILVYNLRFSSVWDFLGHHNSINIPPVHNKEGGVLREYLDGIPYSYGRNVFKTLRVKEYISFSSFLEPFMAVVKTHYKQSVEHSSLKNFVSGRSDSSHVKEEPKRAPVKLPVKPPFRPYHKVHNVEGTGEEFDLDESRYPSEEPPQEPDSNLLADGEAQSDALVVQKTTTDSDYETEMQELLPEAINMIAPPRATPKSILKPPIGFPNRDKGVQPSTSKACLGKLLYGECKKPNCTYAHDPASLAEGAKFFGSKLDAWRRPHGAGSVTMLSEDDSYLTDIVNYEDLLYTIAPERSILNAVHCPGRIVTEAGIEIPLKAEETLFDSGALHANYCSLSFFQKNELVLASQTRNCKGYLAKVADGRPAKVDHVVSMTLYFVHPDTSECRMTGDFYVLEGLGVSIIIGLPDIIRQLSDLFIAMLNDAIDSMRVSLLNSVEDPQPGEILEPWSKPLEGEAPEDACVPEPCSFPLVLHFMELTPEEAYQEFVEMIPDHVSKAMLAAVPIKKFLMEEGYKSYIPQSWDGIRGCEPLKFRWAEDTPTYMKPNARPVNPKIMENAKIEFKRLMGYMYRRSESPVASPLVIAPKATKPFIRFCGDYTKINKSIVSGHPPIPRVQICLQKITGFKVFADIDMTNSFHQFRLAEETSRMLSIQTPWGQVEPMFLPEGVPPASGILQTQVERIYAEIESWCITIFDNFLLLAHSYEDLFQKYKKFDELTQAANLYLKFAKTNIGYDQVEFFGYLVKHNSYGMTEKRKAAIDVWPFPDTTKKMRSFLGASLIFKDFVKNFSDLTGPLHQTVHKNFDWNEKTWKVDYKAQFEKFKAALQEACFIYYPDYDLPWTIQTDASDIACAMRLFQVKKDPPPGEPEEQTITFASHKFSPQALKWKTYDKEGYGSFFAVKVCEYLLQGGKFFLLATDHANFRWMEDSPNPRVIRWKIYLQAFNFRIVHIAGKTNIIADYQSRMFSHICAYWLDEEDVSDGYVYNDETPPPLVDAAEDLDDFVYALSAEPNAQVPIMTADMAKQLADVHGKRRGHFGTRRTWISLNELYPGHRIPYRLVDEYIQSCAVCQKTRLGLGKQDAIAPIVRHLKPANHRSQIGIDGLTVSPTSYKGNIGLYVIVNHGTSHSFGYVTASFNSTECARALFTYYTTFGTFDSVISDPGSEILSESVTQLNEWLGVTQKVSLVDRHESNGVEGTNKQCLRHLRALIMDERNDKKWDEPENIGQIFFLLNSSLSTESGVVPFEATFGSADSRYLQLPDGGLTPSNVGVYVKHLDENLDRLRKLSAKFQRDLVAERTQSNLDTPQNVYQPGDLVLHQVKVPPTKLSPRFFGPYEVMSQVKNDVTCKHLVQASVHTFHVSELKMFHGSREAGYEAALRDFNQFEIDTFLAYRGDPMTRTTMEFLIRYKDGTETWIPWNEDIFQTVAYEEYCKSIPALFPIVTRLSVSNRLITEMKRRPITEVAIGDSVYVDLRSYSATWYSQLPIPDRDMLTYVVIYRYTAWTTPAHRKIHARCDVFDEEWDLDHLFVHMYGSCRVFNAERMRLVDREFITQYPQVAPHGANNADV